MTKSELRKIYLAKRQALSTDEMAAKSLQIADLFFESVNLTNAKTFHTFITIEKFNEIDTSLIYERIHRDLPHIRTVASRANFENREMELVTFDADIKFIENRWGIREPANGGKVDAAMIDVVLVPLLCIDTRGFRVGYGKGFYDRFLSRCRPDCMKIGLSYFPAVEAVDDVDDYDVPLDFCIMPEWIFTTENTENTE